MPATTCKFKSMPPHISIESAGCGCRAGCQWVGKERKREKENSEKGKKTKRQSERGSERKSE